MLYLVVFKSSDLKVSSCRDLAKFGKEGQPWRQALHNRGDSQYFAFNELPQYSRRRISDLTNHLHGSAGFRTDTQIVTKKKMRSIIAQTKKREKDEEENNKQ